VADRLVPCPACKAPALYSPANRWRPFCSERCRGADLGAWANENYRVAGAAPTDGDEEAPAPPPSGRH
jgi:uncharacterized protein